MKKLFTLLVIFTFFVSALSVAQVQKKGETKKDKQIEKVNQRDPGIKDFDNRKLMFEQNQAINPLFVNPPTMSPKATIQIGSGVGTNTYLPIYSYYGYSYSQQIYTQAQIATLGTITKIRFYYSAGATNSVSNNWTIYLGHTTKTTFSSTTDWVPTSSMTQVYSGIVTYPSTGNWLEVTLSIPFDYNNTNNLVVAVDENAAGYEATAISWNSFTSGTNTGIYYRSDGTNPNPTAPPTASGRTATLAQCQLEILPAGTPSLSVVPSSINFGYVPYPTTSTTKTYVLSGTNLTAGPVVVTAPTGFQVSLDGSTWASSVNVTYTAPTLANTTIHTHFVPPAAGTPYSGNITNVGGGASTNVAVSGTSLLTYCTSSATSTADDDIGNVTFGTINNGTATPIINNSTSVNLYTDFTGTVAPTDIQRNLTYPISVSGIWSAGAYTAGVSVYVDFNLNGDFTDAGEGFYLGQVNGTTNTITGNIVVPATATVGNVRMRVILVEFGAAINPSCGTYTWGETEDYLVNVTAPTPTVPSVTTNSVTIASPTTATTGGNVTFDGLSSVTVRGVCWNTSGNPTLSDNFTTDGSGIGTFSSTMTSLTIGQTYYVKAYATNTTGTGYGTQVVYSHFSLTPPFTENFDGVTAPALPNGWSMQNVNGDGYVWATNAGFPNTTPNSMYIHWNAAMAMNDWFFSPPVYLETGKIYQVGFQYASGGSYPEKLEVKYGSSPTAAGMTSSAIFSNTNILNTAYTYGSGTMTVASNGYYYFGWHGFSDADMYNLFVDDITVQEALNNDLLVEIMYAKGKVPLECGANDVITATVKNVGIVTQTSVNVTLDITGGNTFNNIQTIASIAPGASQTVTFTEFVASATGTNNISVSVPNDENNSNNSKTFTQQVTTNTIAYSDNSAATTNLGWATGSGTILTKYHANGTALIGSVNVFIANDPTTTGNTVYGVVLNTAGTIVGQSANYVVQATDLGTWKTFNITTPPDVSNLDYYVGLAQTANATAYYPLGTQTESPVRSAAFYTTALTGGAFTEQTTFGRFMIEAVLFTPKTYYSKSSGDLSDPATWGTATDGSGTVPANFTNPVQTFNIRNNSATTIGANWVVAGTNSKIILGDGTNASTFTIPSGFSLTGSIDLSANATLINQNTLNPTFGTINSSSLVNFNGSSPQTIPAGTYGSLTIDNTSGVSLGGDISVNTGLTLTNGILTTTSSYKITFLASATNPNETTNNRIVGTSVMENRTVGTGSIYFLNCNIAGGTDVLGNVKITRKTGPDGAITFNGNTGIQSNWDILSTNPPSAGRDVTFEWLPVYDPVPPFNSGTLANIYYSSDNGTSWILTGNDVDPTAYGSLRGFTVNTTHFSMWTIGRKDAPLPVQLSSFTSLMKGRDVSLKWTTEKEINNAGFDVERAEVRSQNSEYKKIGFIPGKGSSNSPVNYTFEDKKLNSGKYNYRLKQIDNNGNFEYHNLSTVVDVALPKKFNLSQNYPNPFNPITKIDFDLPFDSKVSINMYDITGREVKTLVNDARTAGFHTVQFNASSLSSGTYFYRIMTKSNGGDYIMTKKMVLIK